MYKISVLTNDGWRFLKPTGGSDYTYNSEAEAVAIAQTCYPDAWRERLLGGEQTVRIVHIQDQSETPNGT